MATDSPLSDASWESKLSDACMILVTMDDYYPPPLFVRGSVPQTRRSPTDGSVWTPRRLLLMVRSSRSATLWPRGRRRRRRRGAQRKRSWHAIRAVEGGGTQRSRHCGSGARTRVIRHMIPPSQLADTGSIPISSRRDITRSAGASQAAAAMFFICLFWFFHVHEFPDHMSPTRNQRGANCAPSVSILNVVFPVAGLYRRSSTAGFIVYLQRLHSALVCFQFTMGGVTTAWCTC